MSQSNFNDRPERPESDLRARWEADAREEALSYDEEVARWGVADQWDEPEDYSWFYEGDEDEGPEDSLGLFNEDGTWNYDRDRSADDATDTPF